MIRRLSMRVGLTLALAGLLTHAARAQEGSLEALLQQVENPRDVAGIVTTLATTFREEPTRLFEPLATRPDLTRLQRTALELALEELPHESALAPLRAAARRTGVDAEREAALALLSRLGTRGDLALALELGAADVRGEGAPSERSSALERCLAAILLRETGSVQYLCELLPRSDPSTLSPGLRALARGAGEEAAARLAGLLTQMDAAARALILDELARVAARGVGLDDLGVSDLVRTQLGSPDRGLAVLACGVLEKLRDHGAVPDLIVLLADSDENLRTRAHTTLRRLTGLELPAEEEPWLAWLDEAMTWWDTQSEATRVALASGSPAEAAAAVNALARQRYRRDLVVQALELALARPEVDLVESALTALGAMNDPRAQLVLQRFRDEERAEVAPSLERVRERIDQRVADPGRRKTIRTPQRTRKS